jgi:hypothetical protein
LDHGRISPPSRGYKTQPCKCVATCNPCRPRSPRVVACNREARTARRPAGGCVAARAASTTQANVAAGTDAVAFPPGPIGRSVAAAPRQRAIADGDATYVCSPSRAAGDLSSCALCPSAPGIRDGETPIDLAPSAVDGRKSVPPRWPSARSRAELRGRDWKTRQGMVVSASLGDCPGSVFRLVTAASVLAPPRCTASQEAERAVIRKRSIVRTTDW